MNAMHFITEAIGPVVAIIGGGIAASALGVPQGVGFDQTLVFAVFAVVAVAVMVAVVGYGLFTAIRDEIRKDQ